MDNLLPPIDDDDQEQLLPPIEDEPITNGWDIRNLEYQIVRRYDADGRLAARVIPLHAAAVRYNEITNQYEWHGDPELPETLPQMEDLDDLATAIRRERDLLYIQTIALRRRRAEINIHMRGLMERIRETTIHAVAIPPRQPGPFGVNAPSEKVDASIITGYGPGGWT